MAVTMSPPPDGSPPLHHTAVCETCRPRRVVPYPSAQARNEWANAHTLTTGHPVTSGTVRARVTA